VDARRQWPCVRLLPVVTPCTGTGCSNNNVSCSAHMVRLSFNRSPSSVRENDYVLPERRPTLDYELLLDDNHDRMNWLSN